MLLLPRLNTARVDETATGATSDLNLKRCSSPHLGSADLLRPRISTLSSKFTTCTTAKHLATSPFASVTTSCCTALM